MKTISIKTPREGFINITHSVAEALRESKIQSGLCTVFVHHTTAGVTINENADPDVVSDMLMAFDKLVPSLDFRHMEGNSQAHIKSSIVGCSLNVIVENSSLVLGTWQGIYFCEFDGPRNRQFHIQFQKNSV